MAQTLLPNAKQQFFDANGNPLAGGQVFFYVPNTDTLKNTWQDEAGDVLNTNPVILDGAGEALIYGTGSYRQLVQDSLGNTIWDQFTQAPLNPDNNLSDVTDPAAAVANIGAVTQAQLSALVPPGSIIMWGSTTPPDGWLECNGAAISRTDFLSLFQTIGTKFGVGNGTTTFNIPDFRGYFARGWVDDGTIDPARTFGSTQTDDFKAHTHVATVTDAGHQHGVQTYASAGVDNQWISAYATSSPGNVFSTQTATTGVSIANANTGGTETRPVNVAVLYIIKK